MADIIIYHNGRCSKSRGALEILQEKNIPHTVRWYLTEPLTEKELATLLKKLRIPAKELVRKNEGLYKEQYKGRQLSEQEWIAVLAANPILIERPIVEKGSMAIVARPPEKIMELL